MELRICTEQEEAFAQHWALHRNGIAAYRHAYNVQPGTKVETMQANSSEIRRRPHVAARVDQILSAATDHLAATFGVEALGKMFLDIAMADPNELIGLQVGSCRYCWGEEHKYQWKEHEYLEALDAWERKEREHMPDLAGGFGYRMFAEPNTDCPRCEGRGAEHVVARDTTKLSPGGRLLYGGVKAKRDGLEVVIADRQKALETLGRILGAFKDNVHLGGFFEAAVQSVTTRIDDPIEAERFYREQIAARLS